MGNRPARTSVSRRRIALCALATACALSTAADANVAGTTTQLSTATSTASATETQTAPALSGTGVVWTDTIRYAAGGSASDIWYLDVGGAPARNLTNTPLEQEFLEDIDGKNVVYTHVGGSASGDIVLLDLSTGIATTLAGSDATVRYEQPSLSGSKLVYVRWLNGQYDIDGYDLSLGAPFPQPLTNDAAVQSRPRVGGDTAVWEDYGSSGNGDVYAAQLSTGGAPFAVATGPDAQLEPDVDGNTIVYVDSAGGVDQIWAYDLTTRVGRAITTVASHKIAPRISGSRVVWADDRKGTFDLYSYDLGTHYEDVLVDGAGDQILASIDGNRVVYTSNANGLEEVFLFTIAQVTPPTTTLPEGCDPARTDLVDGPATLTRVGRRPVYQTGAFAAVPGRGYFLCVENGQPDRSLRTAHLLVAVDGVQAITPASVRPERDPPRWLSTPILDGRGHGGKPEYGQKHRWAASLFGSEAAAQVRISVRVHK